MCLCCEKRREDIERELKVCCLAVLCLKRERENVIKRKERKREKREKERKEIEEVSRAHKVLLGVPEPTDAQKITPGLVTSVREPRHFFQKKRLIRE